MEDEPATTTLIVAEGDAPQSMSGAEVNDHKNEKAKREADAAPKEDEDPDDVDAQLEAMKRRLDIVEAEAQRIQLGSSSNGTTTMGEVLSPDTSAPTSVNEEANAGAGSAPSNPASTAPAAVAGVAGSENVDAAISESDARSVYVGNVDYGATVEELGMLFSDCGTINRVTIMTNKATGMPKGFAYIEFAEESSVKHATILDNSMFRERKLKVVPKRTNVPGMSHRGRGRGRYGRGYGRGYGRRPRRGMRGRWAPY